MCDADALGDAVDRYVRAVAAFLVTSAEGCNPPAALESGTAVYVLATNAGPAARVFPVPLGIHSVAVDVESD